MRDPIVLGSFVEVGTKQRQGRVIGKYLTFAFTPHGEGFEDASQPPLTQADKDAEWALVLLDGAGTVLTPVTRCTVIPPFDFSNAWDDLYFPAVEPLATSDPGLALSIIQRVSAARDWINKLKDVSVRSQVVMLLEIQDLLDGIEDLVAVKESTH